MAIERQRFPTPANLQEGGENEEEINVEVEEEESEPTTDFQMGPDGQMIPVLEQETTITSFDINLAEVLDERYLGELTSELLSSYDEDKSSRQEWLDGFTKGLDLLGIKAEDRDQPFAGASGVTHPLLSEATTQFQAQAYKELLPPNGPVSTKVVGEETPESVAQANRVREFMNYQITEVMEDYDPEMDQLLFYLPLSGSAFKKVYYDSILDRPSAVFVKAEDLVVSYDTTNLETSPRITHSVNMTGNDIRKMQLSGVYKDVELGGASGSEYNEAQEKIDELQGKSRPASDYNNYTILEFHVDLELEDIDEYEVAVPYIVSILEDTGEILSIRRNWNPEDPSFKKKEYFVHYKFLPGLGFYGFGLIHMIGGLTKSATAILRQLIDAGTLSNLPAGFKARGMRIQGEDEPLSPGEFRDVDVPGGAIRDALMPLPYKEPSSVLGNLLGLLIDSGRRFASIADMQVGDIGSQQLPVGTTVAMLERGTKVMSAIHKRLHFAQRKEFKLLAEIFAKTLPPIYPYAVKGGAQEVKALDFDDRVDILPVSDPNIFSMSQRVMLAQQQLQMAGQAPDIHNLREAYKRMYEALEVKNIDAILPPPTEVMPKDPITEQQAAMMGQPIKAFEFQNHEAYIAAHSAFLQNPMVANNNMVVSTITANIQEHQAMLYKQQIEQALGQQLPPMDQMTPEMMNELALVAAQATQQVTGQAQAMAQAQQNAGIDPILALKEREIEVKQQSDALRSQVDLAKIESNEAIAEMKIARDREKETNETFSKALEEVRKSDTDNRSK